MSVPKRADILASLQKVLAKHYKPIKPVDRPLLEQLLYASCLEDSRPDVADECFARLQESFFDWNEVRVTTVSEMSEVLRGLHDPQRSATLIKQTLHSVFEAIYDFDLESMRKQNLGAAVKQLQSYRGTTPFSVNYAVQTALGGHAIPVSQAGMEIMRILALVNEKSSDAATTVPGLERAIPKNKGIEFASLLQQFSADYAASPFGNAVRSILLEIDPESRSRFPKRAPRKGAATEAGEATEPGSEGDAERDKKARPAKPVAKAAGAKPASKPAKKKTSKKAPSAAKPSKPSKKTSGAKSEKKSISKKAVPGGKKSPSKQLARRKPR